MIYSRQGVCTCKTLSMSGGFYVDSKEHYIVDNSHKADTYFTNLSTTH